MLIVGIDPGIARTGWAVIETEGSKVKAKEYGCIETEKNLPMTTRLSELHEAITNLLKKHKPDALAIEDLFFSNNAKTAFVVGQARGVILLAAGQKNIPVAIYTPLQVKIAVTGYGRAEKPQVGQMIKAILGLKTVPKLDDTADALAIALTHAFTYKTKNLL